MATFYDSFSEYYDQLGVSDYSLKLGRGFLSYWKDNFPEESMQSHLDVCCGTGTLCGFMKEHGIDTTGYDLSEGMIRKARQNYPGINFIVADAAEFNDGRQYDFATCTDDAVNHITEPEIVKKAFRTTANELRQGGLFFFDLNIAEKLQIGDPYTKGLNAEEELIYHIVRTSEKTIEVRVTHQCRGIIDWQDKVCERMYSEDEIRQYLREAGLELLECRNDFYEATRPVKNIYIARKS